MNFFFEHFFFRAAHIEFRFQIYSKFGHKFLSVRTKSWFASILVSFFGDASINQVCKLPHYLHPQQFSILGIAKRITPTLVEIDFGGFCFGKEKLIAGMAHVSYLWCVFFFSHSKTNKMRSSCFVLEFSRLPMSIRKRNSFMDLFHSVNVYYGCYNRFSNVECK